MVADVMMLLMVLMVCIGFVCALRTTAATPMWARVFMVSPAFGALYTLYLMASEKYVAYQSDIALSGGALAVYVLLMLVLRNKSPFSGDTQ